MDRLSRVGRPARAGAPGGRRRRTGRGGPHGANASSHRGDRSRPLSRLPALAPPPAPRARRLARGGARRRGGGRGSRVDHGSSRVARIGLADLVSRHRARVLRGRSARGAARRRGGAHSRRGPRGGVQPRLRVFPVPGRTLRAPARPPILRPRSVSGRRARRGGGARRPRRAPDPADGLGARRAPALRRSLPEADPSPPRDRSRPAGGGAPRAPPRRHFRARGERPPASGPGRPAGPADVRTEGGGCLPLPDRGPGVRARVPRRRRLAFDPRPGRPPGRAPSLPGRPAAGGGAHRRGLEAGGGDAGGPDAPPALSARCGGLGPRALQPHARRHRPGALERAHARGASRILHPGSGPPARAPLGLRRAARGDLVPRLSADLRPASGRRPGDRARPFPASGPGP